MPRPMHGAIVFDVLKMMDNESLSLLLLPISYNTVGYKGIISQIIES